MSIASPPTTQPPTTNPPIHAQPYDDIYDTIRRAIISNDISIQLEKE
jgi:hypothetical protein